VPYRAEFYETTAADAISLQAAINHHDAAYVQVLNVDNHLIIERHNKYVKYQYGAAYVDPSNAEIPFDVLHHLCKVYPRMDFIINLACASYKRSVDHPDYVPLDETLPKLKRFWKVRKPIGKHQWSILIGTNWDNYPDLDPARWRFHDIRTLEGRSVYEELVWTKRQLTDKTGQMTLFDVKPYATYAEYLKHPKFLVIRQQAMDAANWICQRCKTARATEVHHLRYPKWGTFDVIENLLPVCHQCHCDIHGKEN
jgi:hypothetical protein